MAKKKYSTIDNAIKLITANVCSKCNFYNQDFGICTGEALPLEAAILRNLTGQGTCSDVKKYISQDNKGITN